MNDLYTKFINFILTGLYLLLGIFILLLISDSNFQQNAFLDSFYIKDPINLKITYVLYAVPVLLTSNSIYINSKYYKVKDELISSKNYHLFNAIILIFTASFSLIFHNYLFLAFYLIAALVITNLFFKAFKIKPLVGVLFIIVYFVIYTLGVMGFISIFNFSLISCELVNKSSDTNISKLYKQDFRNRNFVNSNFYDSTILDSNFDECNLNGASFEATTLSDKFIGQIPHFKNTSLRNTSFKDATLFYADFTNAKFDNTDFTNAKIEGSHFDYVDLRKCKGLSIEQFQNISVLNSYLPKFVLDSIKSDPNRYKFLIKNNIYY